MFSIGDLVDMLLMILGFFYTRKPAFVTLYEHVDLFCDGVLITRSRHVFQHLVSIPPETEQDEYIDRYSQQYEIETNKDPDDVLFLENAYGLHGDFLSRKFLLKTENRN